MLEEKLVLLHISKKEDLSNKYEESGFDFDLFVLVEMIDNHVGYL